MDGHGMGNCNQRINDIAMTLLEAEKVLTGFAEAGMKAGLFQKFEQVNLIQTALKAMVDGQKMIETLTKQLSDGGLQKRGGKPGPSEGTTE
jgi:hypothetical protein